MAGYVFENVEIASYTVLVETARRVGDTETEAVCRQILAQEVAMAQWMLEHMPSTVEAFLSRSETPGVAASH
jgi:ferritin-like metal-binding protein YciE